jgi:siderophore synthetase component
MINKLMLEKNDTKWLAEAATIERLLNTYLREREIQNPIVTNQASLSFDASSIETEIKEQGELIKIELPLSKKTILGPMKYNSFFGHHKYGHSFWIEDSALEYVKKYRKIGGWEELATILLNEIKLQNGSSEGGGIEREVQQFQLELVEEQAQEQAQEQVEAMLQQISNSKQKIEHFVDKSKNRKNSLLSLCGFERVYVSEQSLLYGHPFHPTPKSSEGFSPEDLELYAPEMGASFRLHYFAVAPDLIHESFLSDRSDEELFFGSVLGVVKEKLSNSTRDYKLLPCHPWQANYLKKIKEVQELLELGRMIDLGEMGNQIYPTSSVRTVWDPFHRYIFKLPLNVRITNFIRVNPLEQLHRTMDASRVIAGITDRIPYAHFSFLLEEGFRTLQLKEGSSEVREKIAESIGVIFRDNPINETRKIQNFSESETPTVVASLLEEPPFKGESPLWEGVRLAARSEEVEVNSLFIKKWLKQYLDNSLLPIVWLFLEYGISVEAHVQNTMVTIEKGWPTHFYVRDLEGVSISREQALKHKLIGETIREDSPVLYTQAESWHRLKYYFFVNHLGHLIHTLAYYGKVDEVELWQVVREQLLGSDLFGKKENRIYLDDLVESCFLPAKANFISCFQKRGETPVYVKIRNPLHHCEVKHENRI